MSYKKWLGPKENEGFQDRVAFSWRPGRSPQPEISCEEGKASADNDFEVVIVQAQTAHQSAVPIDHSIEASESDSGNGSNESISAEIQRIFDRSKVQHTSTPANETSAVESSRTVKDQSKRYRTLLSKTKRKPARNAAQLRRLVCRRHIPRVYNRLQPPT